MPGQKTYGERPQAPWHPLPLSELLIVAGAVAFAVGLSRNEGSSGGPLLLAGILVVALGTLEVTWREHDSGFRSHALLLALFPVLILHSAVVLGVSLLTPAPQLLTVGMVIVDIALYLFLYRLLRVRFETARARRVARD
jgi:hypothetical protein